VLRFVISVPNTNQHYYCTVPEFTVAMSDEPAMSLFTACSEFGGCDASVAIWNSDPTELISPELASARL
jgi:hypothetical protein